MATQLSHRESFADTQARVMAQVAAHIAQKEQFEAEAVEIAAAELNSEITIQSKPCPVRCDGTLIYRAFAQPGVTVVFDYVCMEDYSLDYFAYTRCDFGKWSKGGWDVFINQYHASKMKDEG